MLEQGCQSYSTSLHRCFCLFPESRGCWGFCSRKPGHHPLEEERQTEKTCGQVEHKKRFHLNNQSVRTYKVFSEHVLSNVLKQRGEDGQQGEGGVVDDLSDASRLLSAVGELTELQVLLRLLQVFCRTVKVRPQRRLHWLQTSLHHCPDV